MSQSRDGKKKFQISSFNNKIYSYTRWNYFSSFCVILFWLTKLWTVQQVCIKIYTCITKVWQGLAKDLSWTERFEEKDLFYVSLRGRRFAKGDKLDGCRLKAPCLLAWIHLDMLLTKISVYNTRLILNWSCMDKLNWLECQVLCVQLIVKKSIWFAAKSVISTFVFEIIISKRFFIISNLFEFLY